MSAAASRPGPVLGARGRLAPAAVSPRFSASPFLDGPSAAFVRRAPRGLSHNPRFGGMAGSRGVLRGQAGRRSCCSSPAPPFSLFLGRIMGGIRLTAGRRRPARAATLAGYLAELHEQGRAPSSASTAVAAARFRARLPGEPSPAGETTGPGSRRLPADRRRSSRATASSTAKPTLSLRSSPRRRSPRPARTI